MRGVTCGDGNADHVVDAGCHEVDADALHGALGQLDGAVHVQQVTLRNTNNT